MMFEHSLSKPPTKEASPPPLAGTRHQAKKFSSLFLICVRRIFSSKRKGKLFCLVLLSMSRAAGLASIFCKNTAEFPPHPPSAVFLRGRTGFLAATRLFSDPNRLALTFGEVVNTFVAKMVYSYDICQLNL